MRCVTPRPVHIKAETLGGTYVQDFPCGKCYACRTNRTNSWIVRLEMEMRTCKSAVHFLTLTYSPDNLPVNSLGNPTLCLRDMQLFMKRLRKNSGLKLRYMYLGEYGGQTARPHYHAIIFGLPADWYKSFEIVSKSWSLGHVTISQVNSKRIAYCASFHINSSNWPSGTQKPFSQVSRRPGIGYGFIIDPDINRFYTTGDPILDYVDLKGHVKPLPPYIRRKFYGDDFHPDFDIVPLRSYLKEKYPELGFTDAVDYVRKSYELRHSKILKKHGKYIQSYSFTESKEE